jgi:hypothetical protein
MAYGTMFDPNTDMLAKAKQLMQSRGEPAVQFA